MTARAARPERGFAILIVLWALVLVGLIVTHMIVAARQETRLASNLRVAAELGAAADGGVYQALFHVMDKSAGHWIANGVAHRSAGALGSLDVSVRSDAGKVNINTAQVELLSALLHETGMTQVSADAVAANIVAWRSPAGQAQPTAAAYRQAQRGYVPPNAPFESVAELGDVLGMTPETLRRLTPFVTVYHSGDTDPAGAAPVVRQALKDVYGTVPISGRPGGPDESVIEVRAVAERGAARAVREATIRVGPLPDGRLFEILDWRATG